MVRDLTDKPNRNPNRIESESGEESKGDINISFLTINIIHLVRMNYKKLKLYHVQ